MISIKIEEISITVNPLEIVRDRLVMGSNYYATGPEGIVVKIYPCLKNITEGYIYITQFVEFHRSEIQFQDHLEKKPRGGFSLKLDQGLYSDPRTTSPGDGHYAIYKILNDEIYSLNDKWQKDLHGRWQHHYEFINKTDHLLFMDAPFRELKEVWKFMDYAIKFKTVIQHSNGNTINENIQPILSFDWGIHANAINNNGNWIIEGDSNYTSEQEILKSISFDMPTSDIYSTKYPKIGDIYNSYWDQYISNNT